MPPLRSLPLAERGWWHLLTRLRLRPIHLPFSADPRACTIISSAHAQVSANLPAPFSKYHSAELVDIGGSPEYFLGQRLAPIPWVQRARGAQWPGMSSPHGWVLGGRLFPRKMKRKGCRYGCSSLPRRRCLRLLWSSPISAGIR